MNAVISLANGNWHFVLGLGITEVITALSGAGQGRVIGLVITVIVAAFFWGILALGHDWLSVAFHAYALYMLSRAFSALNELEAVNQQAQASGVFPNQPIG